MDSAFDTFVIGDLADWKRIIPLLEKGERDAFIVDRASVSDGAATHLQQAALKHHWGICGAITLTDFEVMGGKGLCVLSAGRRVISSLGHTAERANEQWGMLAEKVPPCPPQGYESLWGSALYITAATLKTIGAPELKYVEETPVVPNLIWDDYCLRARLHEIGVGYELAAFAKVDPSTTAFPGESPGYHHWKEQWGWDPFLPNLYDIRKRWLKTPLVKAVLEDLIETWPSAQPPVEAIMLTGNALDKLRPCLASLAKTEYPSFRLRILLNGSRPEVKEELERIREGGFPFPLEIIECPTNVGVPAGLNWLLAGCSARLIARLDDDVELPPNWLAVMVDFMKQYPFCGAIMPAWNLPGKDGQWMYIPPLRIYPNMAGTLSSDKSPPLTSIYFTNFLGGATVLYRKKAIDRAGNYDLRFSPSQNEDVDHGIALRAAGYDMVVHGKVVGIHHSKSFYGIGHVDSETQINQRKILSKKWGRAFAILEKTLDRDGCVVEL